MPLGLVAVVVIAVFGQTIGFEFQDLDDRVNVADNERFLPPSLQSVGQFWRAPFLSLYVPVTYSWWALEASVAQRTPTSENPDRLDARVFHAGNVLLHILGSGLVYLLFERLFARRAAACLGALAYAVHPLHVESVAWITETKGLLAALFSCLALLLVLRGLTNEVRTWSGAVVPSVAYVLALLAKPSVVTLPLMALLLTWAVAPAHWRRVANLAAVWLVIGVTLAVFTKHQQPDEHVDEVPGLFARVGVALDATTFYTLKFAAPVGLCPDYGRTPRVALGSPWRVMMWLTPMAVTALAAALRQRRWALTAWGITLLAIVPASGLIPFEFQNYSTVADRYACLALLGPSLLVTAWLAQYPSRWAQGAVVAGCTGLALMAFVQTGYWRNTTTLFTHTLTINSRSYLAHEKLAAVARRRGDLVQTVDQLAAGVSIRPSAGLHNKLGDALFRLGRMDEAERQFRAAIAADPQLKEPHGNLGIVLARRAQWPAAIAEFRAALTIDPHYLLAQQGLEFALQQVNGQTGR
ncbi:MAG: tetratricopeptide repeat protein [Pirellulales bacterium]|nr:tetratricopeptide repeat protein [Pirellulales bacterium]